MGRARKPKQHESDTFYEAVKSIHATVEYMGLVSWSIISRGSTAIIDGVQKITETVTRNACKPFEDITHVTRTIFGKKAYVDEKIKSIEETIKKLEERLAFLEKYGVRISERDYQEKKKELDKERKEILSLIVEENKRLRDLLKT